jgi:hypothetical protein
MPFDTGIRMQTPTVSPDRPDRVYMVWGISGEKAPIPLAAFPPLAEFGALCKVGGRFGAHNIHVNLSATTSRTLSKTVAGSFVNGGIRAS